MSERVGFIGLGTMGEPMAGHLVQAGHDVVVWNRSPGKSKRLEGMGARTAETLLELASACDVVCLCVNRTEDVEECLEGLRPGLRSGVLIVDHSTIAPASAVRLAESLADSGVDFVDAPVTGGSMGAIQGELTIFLGGKPAAVERAAKIVSAYAKRAEHVGPTGAGQWMKLANQIAGVGALLGLCECVAFAKKAGLDPKLAIEMIGSGAAGSWAFNNYGPRILNEDWAPGFSVKNQRKDLGYCRDAALAINAEIPAAMLADSLLSQLEAAGRGEEATTALIEVYMGLLQR